MKVMIVVLVAIAVAAVLVLFFGAVRPEGNAGDAQEGIGGGFGFLVPRATLEFDDVSGAECANGDVQGFVVGPNAECQIRLPDRSQITLCVQDVSSVPIEIIMDGEEFPEQPIKADALSCDAPDAIPIYDTGTVLTITCRSFATCIVPVVPAR